VKIKRKKYNYCLPVEGRPRANVCIWLSSYDLDLDLVTLIPDLDLAELLHGLIH